MCSVVLTVWGWNWYIKDENSFLLGRPGYLPDWSIVNYATVSRGPCYRPNRKQQGSSKAQAIVHPNGFDFQLLPLGCASLLLAGATGGTFLKHKFIYPPPQVCRCNYTNNDLRAKYESYCLCWMRNLASRHLFSTYLNSIGKYFAFLPYIKMDQFYNVLVILNKLMWFSEKLLF